eukprot:1149263-Pelagomonas_calceolata.AAC.4
MKPCGASKDNGEASMKVLECSHDLAACHPTYMMGSVAQAQEGLTQHRWQNRVIQQHSRNTKEEGFFAFSVQCTLYVLNMCSTRVLQKIRVTNMVRYKFHGPGFVHGELGLMLGSLNHLCPCAERPALEPTADVRPWLPAADVCMQ